MADPYNPADNPDFRSALVALWLATPALVRISRAPYADEASPGNLATYCVLTVPMTRLVQQDTHRNKHVQSTYQFSIFDYDQDRAADLGVEMTGILDAIHDTRPRFADGYLICWDWTGETLMEVPEARSGGAKTIWRQTHTYLADIVNTRGAT
jgi:hypothetical protein